MSSIKVLDVTLRDGGCVNDFNFGQEYMDSILSALEESEVDYIELGYIDENKGTEWGGRTQYCNEQVIQKHFLTHKKQGITYVAMIDYGKFHIDYLGERDEKGIDGIRLAFHKKHWREAVRLGRKIISKGYQFFIQPMLTMRYSDGELLELIEAVNRELPDASGFYIVDSFGEMREKDVVRLMYLIDNNLTQGMTLGFHSHNNLQLSYSNAMSLLSFPAGRNLMLDASVMGMGKGAGNLNTELLLEHLNLYHGKNYKVAPLLQLIDNVINVIHKEMYWGYSVEYYLSSINHCTPSYATHFYSRHMLPIDHVAELLGRIEEDKKDSFDKIYAEELYLQYNASKYYDDTKVVAALAEVLRGKKVLLIAPGRNIAGNRKGIQDVIGEEDVISIGLNHFEFETDYVLITRSEMLVEANEKNCRIIAPSNVITETEERKRENVFVIDYSKWIIKKGKAWDSSGVMSLLLADACQASEIILAGFDGFHVNINKNYCDKTLRRPVTEEEADQRNRFYTGLIQEIGKKKRVCFLTESLYGQAAF